VKKFLIMIVHRNAKMPHGIERVFAEETAQSICLAMVNAWQKHWREGQSQSLTAWENEKENRVEKSTRQA
jgi:hypothetical protein